MKKISALLLCLILCTSFVCGCGDKDKDGVMSDINSTVSKVESDVDSMLMPDSSNMNSGDNTPGNATDSEKSSTNN